MSDDREPPSPHGTWVGFVADVFELAGTLRRAGDALAGEVGQTQARWQLLSVVSRGDWTVAGAARRLGVTRQAVQRVADALVADGLARYDDNPAHRRAPLVRLTDEGRRVLAAITERAETWRARILADLPHDDLAEAHRLVRAVLDRVHTSE